MNDLDMMTGLLHDSIDSADVISSAALNFNNYIQDWNCVSRCRCCSGYVVALSATFELLHEDFVHDRWIDPALGRLHHLPANTIQHTNCMC